MLLLGTLELTFLQGEQFSLQYVCVALGLRLEQGTRQLTVLEVHETVLHLWQLNRIFRESAFRVQKLFGG